MPESATQDAPPSPSRPETAVAKPGTPGGSLVQKNPPIHFQEATHCGGFSTSEPPRSSPEPKRGQPRVNGWGNFTWRTHRPIRQRENRKAPAGPVQARSVGWCSSRQKGREAPCVWLPQTSSLRYHGCVLSISKTAQLAILTQVLCLPWLFFILPFLIWLGATWIDRWTRTPILAHWLRRTPSAKP